MNIVHLGPSWFFDNLIDQVRNCPNRLVSGQACEAFSWLMTDVGGLSDAWVWVIPHPDR